MKNYKVLEVKMYDEVLVGGSFTGNEVEVVGEQVVELEDGRVIEQFLYNIVGYVAENGKLFSALKANIMIFG